MARQKKWAEEEQAEEEWSEKSGTVSGVLIMPLFVGSVEEASDGWMYWLLNSGSACSVLAKQNKERYKRVFQGRNVSRRYLAANRTSVQMGKKVLALNAVMALRILRSSSWNATLVRMPTILSVPLSS